MYADEFDRSKLQLVPLFRSPCESLSGAHGDVRLALCPAGTRLDQGLRFVLSMPRWKFSDSIAGVADARCSSRNVIL